MWLKNKLHFGGFPPQNKALSFQKQPYQKRIHDRKNMRAGMTATPVHSVSLAKAKAQTPEQKRRASDQTDTGCQLAAHSVGTLRFYTPRPNALFCGSSLQDTPNPAFPPVAQACVAWSWTGGGPASKVQFVSTTISGGLFGGLDLIHRDSQPPYHQNSGGGY